MNFTNTSTKPYAAKNPSFTEKTQRLYDHYVLGAASKKKAPGFFALGLILLVLFAVLSLGWGSSGFLFGRLAQNDPTAWTIFQVVRLPRLFACLLAGSALALSGAVIQTVLNNPLASPNLLGINAGACLGQAFALILLPGFFQAGMAGAFVGALAAAGLILLLVRWRHLSRLTLVLAGLAVSQLFSAILDLLITIHPDTLSAYASMKIGSLSGVSMAALLPAACVLAVVGAFVFAGWQKLELLSLSTQRAAMLGLNARRWTILFLFAAALMAGCVVSFAGMLGFLGLLVPAVLKTRFSSMKEWLLACGLYGALLLCVCDFLGRILFVPYEMPAGVLLAILGGPVFLWMLLKGKKS